MTDEQVKAVRVLTRGRFTALQISRLLSLPRTSVRRVIGKEYWVLTEKQKTRLLVGANLNEPCETG